MKADIIDVYGRFNEGRISIGRMGQDNHILYCKVPESGHTIITDYKSLKNLRDQLSIYLNDVRPMIIPQECLNRINSERDKILNEKFTLNMKLETMTADRDAEKSMKATARMQRDSVTQRLKELEEALDDSNTIKTQWRNLAHKHEQTILDLKHRIVQLENPVTT